MVEYNSNYRFIFFNWVKILLKKRNYKMFSGNKVNIIQTDDIFKWMIDKILSTKYSSNF